MINSDPGEEQDFVNSSLYSAWELNQIISNCTSRKELRKASFIIMTYKSHFSIHALERGLEAVRQKQKQLKN